MFLKSDLNHPRVELRMQLCKPIFEQKAHEVLDIESKGKSFIEQAFYLIHLFDWVSVYLADANNIDPSPVKVIDYLKSELAKA
jgi:glucose/mannose-6-phosphate isomerase